MTLDEELYSTVVDTNPVDVASAIEDATVQAAEHLDTDLIYAEMMATYAQLGELLQENRYITPEIVSSFPTEMVKQYEDDCHELVSRLNALERALEFQNQQQWATWCARNMSVEGVA